MIRRIYVDNFKCLVNFELKLDSLSLLVGANGSGKSTLLDALFALRQLLRGSARINDAGIFPLSTRTRWQDIASQVFEIEVCLGGDNFEYRLEIEHEPSSRKALIRHEGLTSDRKPLFAFIEGEVQLYRDNHSKGPTFPADWTESALARVAARNENIRLTAFLEFMRRIVVCGFYPRGFSAESSAEEPTLTRDGANFTAWYRHIMQEHQDLMMDYTSAMQAVISDLRGIRLERVGTDARAFIAVFEKDRSKYELRLDELSDGQRALLALYALVYLTAGQGCTLFLDEPDNYVALSELQPWLMQLSDSCGESLPQAVLCSHHPELIDYLGGDCGLLLTRELSGVTTVKPLANVDLGDALKLSEVIARGWEK